MNRRAVIAGMVGAGLLTVVGIAWAVRSGLERTGLGDAFASRPDLVREWRAAGFPWTEAELPPPPRPKRDGWPLLAELDKIVIKDRASFTTSLMMCRRLAECDGFSQSFYAFDSEIPAPQAAIVRGAANILSTNARRLAEFGQDETAIEDFRRVGRIADAVERQGSFKAEYLANAIRGRAMSDAARAMAKRPPAKRGALTAAVASENPPPPPAAWRRDALDTLIILRRNGGETQDGWPTGLAGRMILAMHVKAWLRLSAASNGLRDADRLRAAIAREESRTTLAHRYLLLPDTEWDAASGRLHATRLTMLRLLGTGSRATPPDAWGRPIRWKAGLPYSLGPDGADHGGHHRRDVPLVVVRPPAPGGTGKAQ